MTVSELIKVLETCPQDMEVEIRSGYEDQCIYLHILILHTEYPTV